MPEQTWPHPLAPKMPFRTVGTKILIIGCCGSGKSTFSRRLQTLTGLPLVHLDNVWWKADATHITREEFDAKLETLLEGDAWILDGDYSRTMERRFRACETVFFLDYDTETCMQAIIGRVGTVREDIPWVEQQLDPELVELVQNYPSKKRPKVMELFAQYPEKQVICFRNRDEAEAWLREAESDSE